MLALSVSAPGRATTRGVISGAQRVRFAGDVAGETRPRPRHSRVETVDFFISNPLTHGASQAPQVGTRALPQRCGRVSLGDEVYPALRWCHSPRARGVLEASFVPLETPPCRKP